MEHIPSFNEYYSEIKKLESCLDNSKTIEEFFDLVEDSGMGLGAVMSSNIASVTLPLTDKIKFTPTSLYDSPPMNSSAFEFFMSNKDNYRRLYKSDWERIMNALLWRLYPDEKGKE